METQAKKAAEQNRPAVTTCLVPKRTASLVPSTDITPTEIATGSNPQEVLDRRIYVLGKVAKPGVYTLKQDVPILHALFQRRDQAQVLDANRGLLRQTDQTMHFGLIECSALGKVRVDISNPLPADDQWNENGALRAELFGKQRACKLVEAWVFEYILNERG